MIQSNIGNIYLIYIVISMLCMLPTNQQKLDNLRDQRMQLVVEKIKDLANHAKEGLTAKCQGEDCSPSACSGFGDMEREANKCLQNNTECDNCVIHEQSLLASGALYHDEDTSDIKDIDYLQRKSLCQSKLLDKHMRDIFQTVETAWIFAAYKSGIFKVYPRIPLLSSKRAQLNEEGDLRCISVDARNRPWYVSATTGLKQVIIILDMSYWMSNTIINEDINQTETYWDYSKKMMDDVILSLTPLDYFCVVLFNRTSTFSIGQPPPATFAMGQATKEMLQYIKEQVDLVDPSTHSIDDTPASYHAAIDMSYQILADLPQIYNIQEPNPIIVQISGKDDCSSSSSGSYFCPRTFWKDGQPPESSYILDIANTYNKRILQSIGIVPRFFTFSIDPYGDENHAVNRMLACQGNAAWTKITGFQAVRRTMNSFRHLLSSAISANKNKVSFSHIYEDKRKICNMTSASKAIFDNQGVLQGVVGLDLCIEELNVTFDNYLEKLESYFSWDTIEPLTLDQCDRQITRAQVFTDNLKDQIELAQATEHSQCPDNIDIKQCYSLNKDNSYVYYFIGDTLSDWQSADEDCSATGGILVSISNKENAGEVAGILRYGNYWIGIKGNGPWKWSNASFNDATEDDPWWLWAESVNADNKEQCGYINRQGIINNVGLSECTFQMKYVCQYSEKPSFCGDAISQIGDVAAWDLGQGVPPLSFCVEKRKADRVEDITDYNVPEVAMCDIDPLHQSELPIKWKCCDKIKERYYGQYQDQCVNAQVKTIQQDAQHQKKRYNTILLISISVGVLLVIFSIILLYYRRIRRRRIAGSEELIVQF